MIDLNKLAELARQAVLTKATVDSAEERMGDEFDEELLNQLIEDSDDATDAFQAVATPEVVISLLDRLARVEARAQAAERVLREIEELATDTPTPEDSECALDRIKILCEDASAARETQA